MSSRAFARQLVFVRDMARDNLRVPYAEFGVRYFQETGHHDTECADVTELSVCDQVASETQLVFMLGQQQTPRLARKYAHEIR